MNSPRPYRCAAVIALLLGGAVACGSGSKANSLDSSPGAPSPTAAATAAPGAAFSTSAVAGLGTVVVDGRGRTVYLLTSDLHKNVPCTDANGCTKAWPDLPLPAGVMKATAGTGIQAALLSTTASTDGETYPTYHGWLMYEYSGDSGPGDANGQGIRSYGGTWYALTPAGEPVMSGGTASPSATGSGGGGYYP